MSYAENFIDQIILTAQILSRKRVGTPDGRSEAQRSEGPAAHACPKKSEVKGQRRERGEM